MFDFLKDLKNLKKQGLNEANPAIREIIYYKDGNKFIETSLMNIGTMPLFINKVEIDNKNVPISKNMNGHTRYIECPAIIGPGKDELIYKSTEESIKQFKVCYENRTLGGTNIVCKELGKDLEKFGYERF